MSGEARAEQDQRALRGDQADAPGGDDRVERAAVEVADDEALEQDADEAREQRAADDRQRQRRPELGDGHRHVGAGHDELAMGEIDDAHHAEDDRKPARAEHQKGACVAELVEEADDGVEHGATCRAQRTGADGTFVPPGVCEAPGLTRPQRTLSPWAADCSACTGRRGCSWSDRSPLRRASRA